MTDLNYHQRCSRATDTALWVLQIVTAATFLMVGCATLSSQPMMVETFTMIGPGQWFRYLTGGIEVASAILLLIPRLTPVGAAILICTMVGAILSHLTAIGGSPLPALVLLCFPAIILWGRFKTIKRGFLKLVAAARAKRRDAAMSQGRRMAMLNRR